MKNTMEKITIEDLSRKMKDMSEIYDIVRLVNPEYTKVINFEDGKFVETQMEPCFAVWDKDERCNNCISRQACVDKHRMTKFEFRKDEAYYVMAVPLCVQDGDNEYIFSMELVNRVTKDFIIQSEGIDYTNELVKAISTKTYKDILTGTYNRRYFDEKRYLYDTIQIFPRKIGFLLIEINQFKEINDLYGHTRGDQLLTKVGEILTRSFRNSDKVIRFGGDEFLVVVKECSENFLEKKTTRIKKSMSEIKFQWLEKPASISVGISYTESFTGETEDIDKLFSDAESDLLRDKKNPVADYNGKVVLVVDDTSLNREIIKDELNGKFHIMQAESGEDALVILKTNHVDVIITDIFMSPMNGYEFMRHVRNNPNTRNIQIIAITENEESSQSKAIASGADIFIDRPTEKHMLMKAVMKLVGQDHGRSEMFDMDFILDSIPGAVLVAKYHDMGVLSEIIYCSRGIYNIVGLEATEFIELTEQPGYDIIYPADRNKYDSCIMKIINTKSCGEVIFRSYNYDGSIVWLWLQGRYVGEEDGFSIMEQIVLDVSNSTNMYESVLDEASTMIDVIDQDTFEILYENKTAKEFAGDNTGHVCYEKFSGRACKCDDCVVDSREDEISDREWHTNGKIFKQTFKKILWNGRSAILECLDDVTQQKELQRYTENEKHALDEIIKNVPAGLFVFQISTTGEFRLKQANPSACDLMGIDLDKTIGSGTNEVYELTHPEDRKTIEALIKKMSVPNTTISYEYRQYNKKKKEYRWMSAMAHSVINNDGIVSVYVSYFDVTEQKKVQKLSEDLKIARMENKAKTDFMSNMSHDMRTPLNGILGLSELMVEKEDINELHSDAKQLITSGKILLNLINDTLDMNRIESGKLKLKLEPVDSLGLFKNVISTIGVMSEMSKVKLLFDIPKIPESEWVPVITDEARVEQILINIISNAIKFSNEGGTVELHMKNISISEDEVFDEYKIVDHGIGMSEEFQKHMYEPFAQEGRKNTLSTQGTGLGMAIVKQLVELLDGKIVVESKINVGTTVTLFMRYDRYKGEDWRKTQLEVASKDIKDITGMKVLLCEDHPLNRKIAIQILNRRGVEVTEAENGLVGLNLFKDSEKGHFNAILMDVRMPVMDGIETAKAIRMLEREDAAGIPIIAMTANAFLEDKEETRKAGMNEHLAKPVEPKELYNVLAKYY